MLRMTWKVQARPKRMRSPGINGEGELRGQPANPGSPGKMAIKTECVCKACHFSFITYITGRSVSCRRTDQITKLYMDV